MINGNLFFSSSVLFQTFIEWFALVMDTITKLFTSLWVITARAAIGAFLGGVAGTNVVQVGIADDDGRNGSDYQSEKCEWELVAACLVTR